MRYFNETTKELIENPNFDLGKVSSNDENFCTATWTIDVAEQYHYEYIEYPEDPSKKARKVAEVELEFDDKRKIEVVSKIVKRNKRLKEKNGYIVKVGEPIQMANGGERIKVIDVPEEGHWEWFTEEVYGVPEDIEDPVSEDHSSNPIYIETVSLWHVYTQTELDEIEKQKKEQEEKSKISSEQQSELNSLVTLGGAQAAIDHDAATCELYNAASVLLAQQNSITNKEPFCQAFARRIERAEITLSQCPEDLKARITEIENSKPLCNTEAGAEHGTITGQGKTIMYRRGSQVTLELSADTNYRVPTQEEFNTSAEVYAESTEGEEIEDFKKIYIWYNVVANKAYLSVTIPDNCASITISVSCVSSTTESFTVNFTGDYAQFKIDGETVTFSTQPKNTIKQVQIVLPEGGTIMDVSDSEGLVYIWDENNNITVSFTKNTTITAEVLL